MDCVNHTGVNATAFCQSCGKGLCAGCVRNAPGGQVLCEPCWTAWHTYQQPFASPHPGAPSPATAAVLGLIPGVGAMYNGQYFKALIHVVIFAVLVSMADHYRAPGWFTRNVFNRLVAFLTRQGISVLGSRVLAVKGRTSGEWRTTPVNLLSHDGRRYLVAARGETQ